MNYVAVKEKNVPTISLTLRERERERDVKVESNFIETQILSHYIKKQVKTVINKLW